MAKYIRYVHSFNDICLQYFVYQSADGTRINTIIISNPMIVYSFFLKFLPLFLQNSA